MRKIYDSFSIMSDQQTNSITFESFRSFFKDASGLQHNLDKLVEIVITVIGEGYPINFFKFAHFHWRYKNKDIDLLFDLIDISKDGFIGVYEIEQFSEVFKHCLFLNRDFMRLKNNMLELEIDRALLRKYLSGESHVQNWIWLMYFGELNAHEYFKGDVKEIDFKRLNDI